jgi:hypothetical protein
MFPSPPPELHVSVDYKPTPAVVAAFLWEGPHQLIHPWISVAFSLPLTTAATTIAG